MKTDIFNQKNEKIGEVDLSDGIPIWFIKF